MFDTHLMLFYTQREKEKKYKYNMIVRKKKELAGYLK